MRTRQKQRIIIVILCAVIIGLAVGYAVLSQQLNINGTGGIASDFNILFTDIGEGTMNGATTINKQITSSTTATFTIDLKSPGSNGEYLITVENRGNIDAYVESINGIEEANQTEPTDIKFSIEDIKVNDKLKAKESKVFKVKVNWSSSSTSIPDTNKKLTLTINFAQDTGNSSGTDTPPSTIGEAVQTMLSQHETYNYMDGTYVKGSEFSGKESFYDSMMTYGFNSIEEINNKFFDELGNFDNNEFNEWGIEKLGLPDNFLELSGKNSLFEALFGMTAEDFFNIKKVDNYVWFDGFLWRIMGKNADGSIRMITEEDVSTIYWSSIDGHQDYDNSYVNDWLNNYFYPKLEHKDLLVNQIWCSETTLEEELGRDTCINNLSKKSFPVGLLSVNEYLLSLGNYEISNVDYNYLKNEQRYWTLTPSSSYTTWLIYSDGDFSGGMDVMNNAYGVRPVINIKFDAIITSGNGTLMDPYIIEELSDVTGNLKDHSHVGEYVTYAGRNYRVVETSSQGTKLILDGYYDSNNDGTIDSSDKMAYGTNCTLCTTINEEPFVNWISNNNETDKNKLVSTTWYRGDYWTDDNYKTNLESTSNPYEGRVGLIRVGEMLSGQSETILSKKHTVTKNVDNTQSYWTTTQFNDSSSYWVTDSGYTNVWEKSSLMAIRPVIMIGPDVQILSGNGTFNSPFRI